MFMETWASKDDLLRRVRSNGYAKILTTMEISLSKPDVHVYEIVKQQGLEFIEGVRLGGQD